jgi:hypothetical protein
MEYREIGGIIKTGDPNHRTATAGTLTVNPETGQTALHDGTTRGGNPIASSSGLIFLASGTTTTNQTLLDLTLPADYAWFHLEMNKVRSTDSTTAVLMAFSTDDGATWLNDTANGDTYITYASALQVRTEISHVDPLTFSYPDALAYIGGWITIGPESGTVFSVMDIHPGDANSLAHFMERASTSWPSHNPFDGATSTGGAALNPAATVAPTPRRINKLRIATYGDFNAGSYAALIATGLTYGLWGFKV